MVNFTICCILSSLPLMIYYIFICGLYVFSFIQYRVAVDEIFLIKFLFALWFKRLALAGSTSSSLVACSSIYYFVSAVINFNRMAKAIKMVTMVKKSESSIKILCFWAMCPSILKHLGLRASFIFLDLSFWIWFLSWILLMNTSIYWKKKKKNSDSKSSGLRMLESHLMVFAECHTHFC